MDDRLAYTIDEFRKATGLGRSTIFEEIRAGRLKSVSVGRRRLIPRRAAEEYFAAKLDAAS